MAKQENLEDVHFLRKLLRYKTGNPSTPCYYCGVPAEEKEHTVPFSYIDELKRLEDMGVAVIVPKQILVYACRECNMLLGGNYYGTPKQRKAELKIKLAKKYRKLLTAPDWDDDEIEELDGRIREYVVIYEEAKKVTLKRLQY